MKFHYETVLVKANDRLFAFYEYNNNIGFVPGEVSFTHGGKLYTTADMMQLLADTYKKKCHPQENWSMHYWYSKHGNLKTQKFIKAISTMKKQRDL